MAPRGTTTTGATATTTRAKRPLLTIAEIKEIAEVLYQGGITPSGANNPNKIAARILAGQEIGLGPIESVNNMMVTNGKATIYGDALPALVLSSGLLENMEETDDGHTCTVRMKRKNMVTVCERSFSMDDAAAAGLLSNPNWEKYPQRMRRFKAVNWCYRDLFADVLKGIAIFEEEAERAPVVSGPEKGQEQEAAVTTTETVSQSPTPTPQPDPHAPATEEQVALIGDLRSWLITKLMGEKPHLLESYSDEHNATWKKFLKGDFQVSKARELTHEQAAIVIRKCTDARAEAICKVVGDATLGEEIAALEAAESESKGGETDEGK